LSREQGLAGHRNARLRLEANQRPVRPQTHQQRPGYRSVLDALSVNEGPAAAPVFDPPPVLVQDYFGMNAADVLIGNADLAVFVSAYPERAFEVQIAPRAVPHADLHMQSRRGEAWLWADHLLTAIISQFCARAFAASRQLPIRHRGQRPPKHTHRPSVTFLGIAFLLCTGDHGRIAEISS
jgi:hypothetical protein